MQKPGLISSVTTSLLTAYFSSVSHHLLHLTNHQIPGGLVFTILSQSRCIREILLICDIQLTINMFSMESKE